MLRIASFSRKNTSEADPFNNAGLDDDDNFKRSKKLKRKQETSGGINHRKASRSSSMEKGKNSDEELAEDDSDGKNWKGILIALLVILIICSLVGLAIFIVSLKNTGNSLGEPITFDDIFSGNFDVKKFNGRWIGDVLVYKHLESGDVYMYNTETNQSEIILTDNQLKSLESEQFWVSADLKYVLVAYEVDQLYKYSFNAKYKIFPRLTSDKHQPIEFPLDKSPERVWSTRKLQYAEWSPSGHSLTFVYNNNLYFQSEPYVTPVKISDNKNTDVIFTAVPDWLYEEEIFYSGKGHWLSPDNKNVAYIQLNETNVNMQTITRYDGQETFYDDYVKLYYPKAGELREGNNPTIKLYVADTSNVKSVHRLISPPSEFTSIEHYITMVKWQDSKHLMITWSNRAQNKSIIIVCNVDSIDCRQDNIQLINNNQYYAFISSKLVSQSGYWKHVALASASMNSDEHKVFLTDGPREVFEIVGHDDETKTLYYTGTDGDPRHKFLYSLKLPNDIKELRQIQQPSVHHDISDINDNHNHSKGRLKVERLTNATACKFVHVDFSASGKFYIETCLGPHVPVVTLRNTMNNEVKVLESNKELIKKLASKALPKKQYCKVKVDDGIEMYGQFFLPPNAHKELYQYPLIINVYGGPGSQQVTEEFKLDWLTYLSSAENVVVASFDGRGTGGRGDAYLHEIYHKLGSIEVEDQMKGAEFMKTMSNINKDRIAIWGWSYGGFVVGHVLGDKDDDEFKCGIAVAPVTDWRYYDTVYTERYMGRPTSSDNYIGYDSANVSRKAKYFKNKKFLLIHGTADDNVHLQHSMRLMKALAEAKVMFQSQIYPDKNHMLGGRSTTKHLYKTMVNFLKDDCWSDAKMLQLESKHLEGNQKQKGKSRGSVVVEASRPIVPAFYEGIIFRSCNTNPFAVQLWDCLSDLSSCVLKWQFVVNPTMKDSEKVTLSPGVNILASYRVGFFTPMNSQLSVPYGVDSSLAYMSESVDDFNSFSELTVGATINMKSLTWTRSFAKSFIFCRTQDCSDVPPDAMASIMPVRDNPSQPPEGQCCAQAQCNSSLSINKIQTNTELINTLTKTIDELETLIKTISITNYTPARCPQNFVPGEYGLRSCYLVVREKFSFSEAALFCRDSSESTIVQINTLQENNFLSNLTQMSSNNQEEFFWMAAMYELQNNQWFWYDSNLETKSPITYSNWDRGIKPVGQSVDDVCSNFDVKLSPAQGTWVKKFCTEKNYFICEFPKECD
ncbi:hypothetical protein HELRODRAFT_161459 [Helobdella robusta]|uniref:C-type lectin domain-containing protein n=1 Tax=Helobdella robusta TaxID=6412 RepID=T1ERH7_HELRO|nr:hypothetical protein HELRODRAFT_161459 [Helobdella robusta]ESO02216.1 hypothetical protein HELRODRAFT_161459 [Helobdella robusta]